MDLHKNGGLSYLKLQTLLMLKCFFCLPWKTLISCKPVLPTGGNQRDLARAKNMKKQQDQGKKAEDGLTPLQRRERLVGYLDKIDDRVWWNRKYQWPSKLGSLLSFEEDLFSSPILETQLHWPPKQRKKKSRKPPRLGRNKAPPIDQSESTLNRIGFVNDSMHNRI